MFSWIIFSVSSLKQQAIGRPVSQIRHIILIPMEPVFARTP